MLCFFLFLMTVSSVPLALVNEKQAKNYVDLFQNKTVLSEAPEGYPGTLNLLQFKLKALLDDQTQESVDLRNIISLTQELLPVVEDLCLPCSCTKWDYKYRKYSNCHQITSNRNSSCHLIESRYNHPHYLANGFCVRCKQDGTTAMPDFQGRHDKYCVEYSRGVKV